MGSEWITLSLQDLGRIITGKTPSTKDSENFGGYIPFVSPRDLDGARYIDNTERTLTLKGAASVKNSIVPERSVLVSCIGSDMGKAAINRRECVTNQQINSIIVSNDFDAKFVYYNLSTRKDEIRGLAGGSAQPILNKGDFGRLEITLPKSISEQRDISRFLSVLDDKIELNRQINTTLESMAQALFKSWFVDFDPVIDNALAAGNEIPDALQKRAAARAARREALRQQINITTEAKGASGSEQALLNGRLPAEIQQLFPDRFVFTEEMGWVPEGWEVATLLDLCSKITDGAHQSPASVDPEEGLPMASSKDLTHQGINYDSCRYISRADFDNLVSNGCMPELGDILIAKDGSRCGETCCIHSSETPVVLLSSVAILKPQYPMYSTFLNTLLAREVTIENLRENYVSGSAIPRIVLKDFKRYPLVKPSESIFQAWESTVESMFKKSVELDKNSKLLSNVRDSLLPKLLSGQLTIPDAEQQLAEVL